MSIQCTKAVTRYYYFDNVLSSHNRSYIIRSTLMCVQKRKNKLLKFSNLDKEHNCSVTDFIVADDLLCIESFEAEKQFHFVYFNARLFRNLYLKIFYSLLEINSYFPVFLALQPNCNLHVGNARVTDLIESLLWLNAVV